jgi:hypothetical protein
MNVTTAQSRWLKEKVIFSSSAAFEEKALLVFQYQAVYNPVYAAYLSHLKIDIHEVKFITQIPFLPISFFQNHVIQTENAAAELIFKSSGTTGQLRSTHYVSDSEWYKKVAVLCFEQFYGNLQDYIIFALLPSYLEQGNSSLVFMIQHFIEKTNHSLSNFYLHNIDEMLQNIALAQKTGKKILLWGVTFALLDMIEKYKLIPLSDVIVIETGGMKGRRQEMIRQELHTVLQEGFRVGAIHSEYGMTELLSQAYSQGNGVFYEGSSMKILLRDANDPFEVTTFQEKKLKRGIINVIDLANVDSCAFIETQDIGVFTENGGFEVLGRADNSELRGCSLLTV